MEVFNALWRLAIGFSTSIGVVWNALTTPVDIGILVFTPLEITGGVLLAFFLARLVKTYVPLM